MTESDLLTVSQAAAELNASNQTIRNWIRSNRLQGVRIGHRFLIPRDNVERMRGGSEAAEGEGPWTVDSDDQPIRLPRARRVDGADVDRLLGE